jgi:hypothetical protein
MNTEGPDSLEVSDSRKRSASMTTKSKKHCREDEELELSWYTYPDRLDPVASRNIEEPLVNDATFKRLERKRVMCMEDDALCNSMEAEGRTAEKRTSSFLLGDDTG